MTITGSKFIGNAAFNSGGAIFSNSGNTVTITESEFIDNEAGSGGAISNSNTFMFITGSKFINNTGTYDGGAISNRGTVTITASEFIDNEAAADGGGATIENHNGEGVVNCNDNIPTDICGASPSTLPSLSISPSIFPSDSPSSSASPSVSLDPSTSPSIFPSTSPSTLPSLSISPTSSPCTGNFTELESILQSANLHVNEVDIKLCSGTIVFPKEINLNYNPNFQKNYMP